MIYLGSTYSDKSWIPALLTNRVLTIFVLMREKWMIDFLEDVLVEIYNIKMFTLFLKALQRICESLLSEIEVMRFG